MGYIEWMVARLAFFIWTTLAVGFLILAIILVAVARERLREDRAKRTPTEQ